MIESIEFKNFKCLRDTTLPLSPCTILVGPNGSGKSTVLQALEAFREPRKVKPTAILTAGIREPQEAVTKVSLNWGDPHRGVRQFKRWSALPGKGEGIEFSGGTEKCDRAAIDHAISAMRVFSLEAKAIAAPVQLQRDMELAPNGAELAGVLTRLQLREEERFQALNAELARWLREFDRVRLDLDKNNRSVLRLRTREAHHEIPAADLSQGTLIALAMLTLAYLPNPPPVIGLEEPDRGIHPRLLRHVKDAIYRLSHPENCGENREPVQVIATTHSPYFLDLFKDHPEEIVIANKDGLDVQFQRLSEQPDIQEILGDAPLGEIWYTGILGGVPANS